MKKVSQIRVVYEYRSLESEEVNDILDWESVSLIHDQEDSWVYEGVASEHMSLFAEELREKDYGLYSIIATVCCFDCGGWVEEGYEYDYGFSLEGVSIQKLGKDEEYHYLNSDTGEKWLTSDKEVRYEGNNGGDFIYLSQNQNQAKEDIVWVECGQSCVCVMQGIIPVSWLVGLISFARDKGLMVDEVFEGYNKGYREKISQKFKELD